MVEFYSFISEFHTAKKEKNRCNPLGGAENCDCIVNAG
jgi:hypothetical protein